MQKLARFSPPFAKSLAMEHLGTEDFICIKCQSTDHRSALLKKFNTPSPNIHHLTIQPLAAAGLKALFNKFNTALPVVAFEIGCQCALHGKARHARGVPLYGLHCSCLSVAFQIWSHDP
jgi:hypothetical protein